jgi:hypothetical protein
LSVTFLAIVSCCAFGQENSCSLPQAEISRISRPTGVLRADPDANNTASLKIAADVQRACPGFSDRTALQQVRIKIADNNIILTGPVPTTADEQALLEIAGANADGRTVFNRLAVVPVQMASRRRN